MFYKITCPTRIRHDNPYGTNLRRGFGRFRKKKFQIVAPTLATTAPIPGINHGGHPSGFITTTFTISVLFLRGGSATVRAKVRVVFADTSGDMNDANG